MLFDTTDPLSKQSIMCFVGVICL